MSVLTGAFESGSITRDEAHRLKGELRAVREDEARMLQDGRLDDREMRRLNKELDRLEKNIYRAKTDDNSGYNGRGHEGRGYGPPHLGSIFVVSATYGGNCGAPLGNGTSHIAAKCNGQKQCSYRIDHKLIGDPARGCEKDYSAQWRCGNGPVQPTSANPEASGSVISLSCQ